MLITTHHQPKYIHHHPPPAKIYPSLPTNSQKMDHHPTKAQIYSHITSFWHCFKFLFYKMQYSFPRQRFFVIKFSSVCFSYSKFLLHSEAATGGVLPEQVFLEIPQNSQENTCARVSLLIKLQAEHLRWLLLNTPFSITIWKNCVKVKKTLN